MSRHEQLPPEQTFVPWEVTDPNLRMGDGWVLPSLADVHMVRDPVIVPSLEAVSTIVRVPDEAEVASEGLLRVVRKMRVGVGRGVGIHAAQVGEPYNLAMVVVDGSRRIFAGLNFVPDLAREAFPAGIDVEGCLSLPRPVIAHPGRYLAGEVRADYEIIPELRGDRVAGLSVGHRDVSISVADSPGSAAPLSRIVQHEADHAGQKLFPDEVYGNPEKIDWRLLTGAVFWVHAGALYDDYVTHLRKIRHVLAGTMEYGDLPELRLPVLPPEQYQALRSGRIVMPKPEEAIRR